MFACYIAHSELAEYYPEFPSTLVKEDTIVPVLKRASKIVARDLINKGVNTSAIYIPKMFDSLAKFAKVSNTGDVTSASIKPVGNEARFVAMFSPGTKHALCKFTVQGSQDDTNWRDLATSELTTDETITMDWPERFTYVRYAIEAQGSVSYSPFVVDTSFDEMIIHKSVSLVMMPHLQPDSRFEAIYMAANARYADLLNGVKADIDTDGDGTIESGDAGRGNSYTVYR